MASIDITTQSGAVGNGDLQLQNGAPMDGTLRFVTDALNTASPLKLSTSLVQTTSTLKITTNDNPYIDAEDGSGNNRFTVGRAPASQQVNVDFASNPTGSTTAVGAIRTYRDGTNLSEAMTFIEDGSVGIGTTAPVGLLDLYKAAAATRLAIRGDAGQNRLISYRTGAVQRFGLYVNNTAESGANAGSNFAIRAYSDAGTLLSTPLFIERSTGNVGINTLTPDSAFDINGLVTISGGEALTLGLKALQLPTGIATNVISAGLSTRTGVAGESIIQMGNNLNTLYTGAVNAAKAGAMIRLDTRGVEPNINSSNYSVFQIQTRAAGVADPNYTVPVQIGAAPNGSFIIKTDGTSAFGGNLGVSTSSPYGKLDVRGGNITRTTTDFVPVTTGSVVSLSLGANTGNTFGSVIVGNNGDSIPGNLVLAQFGGNVGISTTSPQSNLHIVTGSTYGTQINTSQIADTTTRVSIGGFVNDAAGGNGSVAIGGSHHHAATAQSSMVLYTHTGSALTEKMRIDPAGNVGIGTTSPDAKLTTLVADNAFGAKFKATNGVFRVLPFETGLGVKVSAVNGDESSFETLALQGSNHRFIVGVTEVARITSNGLTFNGDTAAANALDDYEEGTWTPVLSFGGASVGIAYTVRYGRYTKIGNQVNATCYVELNSKGTSTGGAVIGGLPFVSGAASGNYSSPAVWFQRISFNGMVNAINGPNATGVGLTQTSGLGVLSALTDVEFQNTSEIIINLTYGV